MTVSRGAKVGLAAATVWPVVYISVFFVLVALKVLARPLTPSIKSTLIVFHTATIVWTISLIAGYLRFLFKSERVAPEYKLPWALALVLGNVVALPVFFWRAVWKEPDVVS